MSETYKVAAIGDTASVSGFAALGLSVFCETDGAKISKLINRLAANGEMTKGAYLDKDARSLVDFMGNSYSRVNRTCSPLLLFDGDYVIVASDGLTDAMSLEKIADYVTNHSVITAEHLKLSVKSSRRPSQDNYTAIVIRMEYDLF